MAQMGGSNAAVTASIGADHSQYRRRLLLSQPSSSTVRRATRRPPPLSCRRSTILLHLHGFPFPPHKTTTPRSSLVSSSSSSLQSILRIGPHVAVVSGKDHRSQTQTQSQTAAVRHLMGSVIASDGLRFALVVARFNEIVTKLLLEGALETFKRYSVKEEDIDVVWVPGSFEIGVVAERLGKSRKYQAILCIGAVIRGDTSHYDAVANSAASGVLSAGLNSGVPCIFGVLTCDNMEQALDRAGGKAGNKGAEAALTAIEMASLFEHHLK